MDITERAFKLYLQGWSLRKLEKHFGVPNETLGYRFRNKYGRDYRRLKNFLPVVREYLKNRSLSAQDKGQIIEWLTSDSLFQRLTALPNTHKKLYTNSEIENLTRRQCNYKDGDWRRLFEVLEFKRDKSYVSI
ncbi:hypothetical protein NIES2100_35200 [Calothrix sp. NIES-2100]|uniref:hypothetical protein n=1 Tax=Calothrix sp. NIES-2100 TaxID=1954172 RepID=UPI000B5EB2DF|nr:hypothetical protein NIES2100_35200 [Calothrix sp. NIES-2100]